MKILFIVYHDLQTEARSQEILQCANLIGDTILVSYSKPHDKSKYILTSKDKKSYIKFVINSIKAIKRENPEVIILHDNYTAIILAWLRLYRNNSIIIFDSSELYIDKVKSKSIKVKIAAFMKYLEKKYLRYADIVIAANKERAEIMKEYYQLRELPIVFDNMHKITESYNEIECNTKYKHLFNKNVFTIVYGGGISKSRYTFELAKVVGELGNAFQLLILGSATKSEVDEFVNLKNTYNYSNINYYGFVPRNEWRYILSKSDVSVSAFSQDTVNNVNCASGKLYESLFEGVPILTSENPPLKRICTEYKIGISTSDFRSGILEIKNNYAFYKNNVQEYIKKSNYDNRIFELQKRISDKLDNIRKD